MPGNSDASSKIGQRPSLYTIYKDDDEAGSFGKNYRDFSRSYLSP